MKRGNRASDQKLTISMVKCNQGQD